jgi:transcription termination factor Rho
LASKDTTSDSPTLPFGTIEEGAGGRKKKASKKKAARTRAPKAKASETEASGPEQKPAKKAAKKKASKKATGSARKPKAEAPEVAAEPQAKPQPEAEKASREDRPREDRQDDEGEGGGRRRRRRKRRRGRGNSEGRGPDGQRGSEGRGGGPGPGGGRQKGAKFSSGGGAGREQGGRDRGGREQGGREQGGREQGGREQGGREQGGREQGARDRGVRDRGGRGTAEKEPAQVVTGMFVLDKGGIGVLHQESAQWCSSKDDVYVSKHLIHANKLRDGSLVTGPVSRGHKHKFQLNSVQEVDGKEPNAWSKTPSFKNLTSIDPDFHYAVGDITDDVSMRIVDLLCPIGRGQRGLIVAPPRSGKTTLMRQFARGIEEGYSEVHLMVLLIDERPEEATEWRRSIKNGKVFVSTSDETAKAHIQLAEAVWKRCCRLVEMGEDVVLLLDSITRLARAYNNQSGSGRTMSGGLDSRAMERPRKIFGSARNTIEAGSLTILGTTLVDTGSRMDNLVFEEFKGTGNMELVLNRKLADRRIFPAIDVEKAGTRKEEKLVGMRRLKLLHTLRRVLCRMNFIEAMELLITRLEEVDKTDDFLKRFEIDPEA